MELRSRHNLALQSAVTQLRLTLNSLFKRTTTHKPSCEIKLRETNKAQMP